MNRSLRISVIVPTRDRTKDLADLLLAVLRQNYPPCEVIIVDDSPLGSAKQVLDSFILRFKSAGCKLRYISGLGDGLPAARNLGVGLSEGDIILFLDDDLLLQNNLLDALAAFFSDHPNALGIQPQVHEQELPSRFPGNLGRKLENAICKAFMLFYFEQNKMAVRRSGASTFPYFYPLREPINAQRLDGCCMCYRRELFDELCFDINLRRWGFMEDLDFSYRVYKRYPRGLYVLPSASVTHKKSTEVNLPSKTIIYMVTIYWFYVFFKDVFGSSILNLIAFFWALLGNLVTVMSGLITRVKPKHQWRDLLYLANSYICALEHLREVKSGNLDFFNQQLAGARK